MNKYSSEITSQSLKMLNELQKLYRIKITRDYSYTNIERFLNKNVSNINSKFTYKTFIFLDIES